MADQGPSVGVALPVDPRGAVRVRRPDRSQVGMHYCSVDELVPADHPVRVVWAAVEQMDLSAFERPIDARELTAGRPANDVRVTVGLWLWSAVDNVAGGRQLARPCVEYLAYRWPCGGLPMNYHTPNDFRTGHGAALDALFTATLGRLAHTAAGDGDPDQPGRAAGAGQCRGGQLPSAADARRVPGRRWPRCPRSRRPGPSSRTSRSGSGRRGR